MTTSQRSIYLDLLAYQWYEGYLPNDEEILAKMAAVSIEEFRLAAPIVMRHFRLSSKGYRNREVARLRQRGLEKIRKGLVRTRVLVPRIHRFAIFQRDRFTCQYCGRRAPNVVLELDHVRPVTKGGGSEDSNLITSCWECNRDKAAKLIDRAEIQGVIQ